MLSRGARASTYWSAHESSDITRGAATATAGASETAARSARKALAAFMKSVRDQAVQQAVQHHLHQLVGVRPTARGLGDQQRDQAVAAAPQHLGRLDRRARTQPAPRGDIMH